MKSKTLIILLVVCCALAGTAYMALNKGTSESYSEMGETLIPGLPINDIAKITIQSTEGNVTLKKGETIWVVENKSDYPADFKKITDLAIKIKDTKIERSFTSDKDAISRLGLNPPDQADITDEEKGTRIVLENKDKNILSDIILGKTKESATGTGGNYLILPKENAIYVVDNNFKYMDKNPSDWIKKELLAVNASDVETVICIDPKSEKPVFTLKRPEKNKDPEFIDLPEGKKIKTSKVNSLFGAVGSLQIEDVTDPAKDTGGMGFDEGKYLEFHMFDGTVYKVFPGGAVENDDTKHYLKAEVLYVKPEIKEPEKKAESEDGKAEETPAKPDEKQKTPDELSAEAKKLNETLSPWTYVISKWRHDNFVTDSVQLFEEEKKEEPKTGAKEGADIEEMDIKIAPEFLERGAEDVVEAPSASETVETEALESETEKAEQPSGAEDIETEVESESPTSANPEAEIEEPHPESSVTE